MEVNIQRFSYVSIFKSTRKNCEIHLLQDLNDLNKYFIAKVKNVESLFKREKNILEALNSHQDTEGSEYLLKLIQIVGEIQFDELSEHNTNNKNFLTFEYLNGNTLSSYFSPPMGISVPSYFDENIVKLITKKILKALKICHEKRICHGGIEISNIMFDNNLNMLLTGFGKADFINNKPPHGSFNKDFVGLGLLILKMLSGGPGIKHIDRLKTKTPFFLISLKKYVSFSTVVSLINQKRNTTQLDNGIEKFFVNLLSDDPKIDELLKEKWLSFNNNDDESKVEADLKKELNDRKNILIQARKSDNNFIVLNIENFLDINNNNIREPLNFNTAEETRGDYNDDRIVNNKDNIKKLSHEPSELFPGYFPINIKNEGITEYKFEKNLCYKFLNEIYKKCKDKYRNDNFNSDKSSLAFFIYFNEEKEEDLEKEEDIEREEKIEEEKENNIEEEGKEEIENLSIKIEIYLYENSDSINNSYYLFISLISGDEFEYYQKIQEIKELIGEVIKDNYS